MAALFPLSSPLKHFGKVGFGGKQAALYSNYQKCFYVYLLMMNAGGANGEMVRTPCLDLLTHPSPLARLLLTPFTCWPLNRPDYAALIHPQKTVTLF